MADLNETQRQICLALQAHDGDADASTIKKWIRENPGREVSTSNLNRQATTLVDDGVIEKTGSKDVGAPLPANVYGLTDVGREIAADADAAPASNGGLSDDAARELRRDISDLQDGVRRAQERLDGVEDSTPEVDALQDRFAELDGRCEDMETRLDSHEESIAALDEKFNRLYQTIRTDAGPQ